MPTDTPPRSSSISAKMVNVPQKRKASSAAIADIPLTIHHGHDISRSRIISDASFLDLCALIKETIAVPSLPPPSHPAGKPQDDSLLRIKYVDDENQHVALAGDRDWDVAKSIWGQSGSNSLHIILLDDEGAFDPMNPIGDQPFAQALVKEINNTHAAVSQQTVTWFLSNMPEAYFLEIDAETRSSHIRAMIALQLTGGKQEMSLVNKSKTIYTYIKSANYVGLLSEVVQSLPRDKPLLRASIYTSRDGTFVIDVFHFDDTDAHARKATLSESIKFQGKSPEEKAKFESVLKYIENTLKKQVGSPELAAVTATKMSNACGFQHHRSHLPKDKDKLKSILLQFLRQCDSSYVLSTPNHLIYHHVNMCTSPDLTHGNLIKLISDPSQVSSRPPSPIKPCTSPHATTSPSSSHLSSNVSYQACLIYVAKPVEYKDLFSRIVKHLRKLGVDIIKAKLNRISLPKDGLKPDMAGDIKEEEPQNILILTCYVRSEKKDVEVAENNALGAKLVEELDRIKWVDQSVINFSDTLLEFGLQESEITCAFCQLLHCILSDKKPLVYTIQNMIQFVGQYSQITKQIIKLFLEKFSPVTKTSLASRRDTLAHAHNEIAEAIDSSIDLEDTKTFFHHFLSIVKFTLKTNLYFKGRLALLLRLEPCLFKDKLESIHISLPFGVFFGFGRGFVGFHTRFRDIARGGIRIVIPRGHEQYLVSNRGLIAEGFGLAAAQQLKNKDIPEGGSKGVILLQPSILPAGAFKAFTDGLLDITIAHPNSHLIVDYYGKDELLYLGPDENVTNDLIEWICKRAEERGHPFPSTFMSSKPGAGINHKQYGVTSEGVTVFLDVALRKIGINPKKQKFTVKLTGGPDGDVAGNEIKILHREYGNNACILAIADGFGVAEDPDGLNHDELLRLVKLGLPIVEFRKDKLGKNGIVVSVSEGDGAKVRNTMHFRIQSDVFIPAGGRPYTINDTNWKQYLDLNANPKSRLIVEGANIFLSPVARENLSKAGVMIVKDSSANKCGVICSSFEILAGMLVNEAEFLKVKEQYVQNVLERLRHLAKLEADLLFRELGSHPDPHVSLPEISVQISKTIIQVADSVEKYLETIFSDKFTSHSSDSSDDLQSFLHGLLISYFPATLRQLPDFSSAAAKVPLPYKKRILASMISSTIVYREGMHFGITNRKVTADVDGNDKGSKAVAAQQRVGMLAVKYLQEADKMDRLVQVVKGVGGMNEEVKRQVVMVLEKGGARVAMDMSGMEAEV